MKNHQIINYSMIRIPLAIMIPSEHRNQGNIYSLRRIHETKFSKWLKSIFELSERKSTFLDKFDGRESRWEAKKPIRHNISRNFRMLIMYYTYSELVQIFGDVNTYERLCNKWLNRMIVAASVYSLRSLRLICRRDVPGWDVWPRRRLTIRYRTCKYVTRGLSRIFPTVAKSSLARASWRRIVHKYLISVYAPCKSSTYPTPAPPLKPPRP